MSSEQALSSAPTFLQYLKAIKLPQFTPNQVWILADSEVDDSYTKAALESFVCSIQSYYPNAKILKLATDNNPVDAIA